MENNNMEKSGYNIDSQRACDNIISDFIREIIAILDSIELELVNIEVDHENPVYLEAVYQGFQSIKGLAGFLEGDVASGILEYTGELLEICLKFNLAISRDITNILLQSILFLRKICNNRKILSDTKFQGEVEQHIDNIIQMKDGIMLEIKQPVKPPENRIGEILAEDGIIKQKDIEYVLEKQSSTYQNMKFGEIALRERKVDASGLIKAIRAQKIRNESSEQYVQIPIKRLDQILQIVDRLEAIQVNLHNEMALRFANDDSIISESKQATDILSDIKEILKELRLVTFKQSFQKLARAVRAMIEEKGLNVIFSTIGENVEVNKEISDEIIVPLARIIEFMLDSFSNDCNRGKIYNIKVSAYKDNDSLIVDIACSKQISLDSIHNSSKIKEAESKIDTIGGSVEYKNVQDNGLTAKIMVTNHYCSQVCPG